MVFYARAILSSGGCNRDGGVFSRLLDDIGKQPLYPTDWQCG